jgi:hypothetical protein
MFIHYMKKNKTAAAIIAAVLFLSVSGCITTGGTKLKNNEFQNAIGAAGVLAGMGAGAYAGVTMAGGNDKSLLFGMTGGMLGAIAAGGVYWIVINLIGEKVDVNSPEKFPADDKLLLPQE